MSFFNKRSKIFMIMRLIFVVIIFYLIFFRLFPYLLEKSDSDRGCKIYHKVYIENLKFKVVKKFTDHDNHNNWTVNYSFNNGEHGTMIFGEALNLMFYKLQPGDSVIKHKNSMYFNLKSKNSLKDSMYEYYVLCKDTLNARRRAPEDKN